MAIKETDGQEYHHRCPKCGELFGCDWRAVAMLEEQARRIKIIAGMWRAKLLGTPIGRPKTHEFSVEAARELAHSGLSLRGIARVLEVHPSAVQRALKK
jgi:DNA invertase Pin-like site-specific DNA recombinase